MIDPLLSSFKTEKKRTKTPWRMKGPEAGLIDTEQNAADSLIELMYQKRKHITKQHPSEEQKQKAKLAINDNESNSSLHPKPQKQRTKREQQQKAKPDLHADINVDSTLQSQKKRNCQSSPALGETKKFKGLQITLAQFRADTAEYTIVEDLCTAKCSFTGLVEADESSFSFGGRASSKNLPNGVNIQKLTIFSYVQEANAPVSCREERIFSSKECQIMQLAWRLQMHQIHLRCMNQIRRLQLLVCCCCRPCG